MGALCSMMPVSYTHLNELNDYVLYTLGLKDQEELSKQWEKAKKGENVDKEEETTYSYDELLKLSFKLILNSDYYEKQGNLWICLLYTSESKIKEKIENIGFDVK